MKFHAVLLFLLGSVAASVAAGSSLKVHERFLTEDEINMFRGTEANEAGRYDNRRHGRTLVESHFVRRLEESGAVASGQVASAELKTSILTQTSRPHKDIAYPESGGKEKIGAEDQVVFVFLNDNPNARFVFGEQVVPVVAGNMVTFDGHQQEHNTVVESGEVHLLGPFESRRLQTVGEDPGFAGGFGDPHFKTWFNEKYDFHGQCDLNLVSDPSFLDKGLQVTIRTKIKSTWSYIASTAIRIGEDILEVQGGEADSQHYWVNGVYQSKLTKVGGFPVSHRKPYEMGHSYTIDLEGQDGQIEVRTWKEFIQVKFEDPTERLYGKTVGLLGDFNTGKKFARDGITVIEDPVEFGQEWQVRAEEPVLFHEVAGPQMPHQKCVMPWELNAQKEQLRGRRRLSETRVTEAMAQIACEHAGVEEEDFDACVFDVLATDDVETAGAY